MDAIPPITLQFTPPPNYTANPSCRLRAVSLNDFCCGTETRDAYNSVLFRETFWMQAGCIQLVHGYAADDDEVKDDECADDSPIADSLL